MLLFQQISYWAHAANSRQLMRAQVAYTNVRGAAIINLVNAATFTRASLNSVLHASWPAGDDARPRPSLSGHQSIPQAPALYPCHSLNKVDSFSVLQMLHSKALKHESLKCEE